jgi:hypothetical protein
MSSYHFNHVFLSGTGLVFFALELCTGFLGAADFFGAAGVFVAIVSSFSPQIYIKTQSHEGQSQVSLRYKIVTAKPVDVNALELNFGAFVLPLLATILLTYSSHWHACLITTNI